MMAFLAETCPPGTKQVCIKAARRGAKERCTCRPVRDTDDSGMVQTSTKFEGKKIPPGAYVQSQKDQCRYGYVKDCNAYPGPNCLCLPQAYVQQQQQQQQGPSYWPGGGSGGNAGGGTTIEVLPGAKPSLIGPSAQKTILTYEGSTGWDPEAKARFKEAEAEIAAMEAQYKAFKEQQQDQPRISTTEVQDTSWIPSYSQSYAPIAPQTDVAVEEAYAGPVAASSAVEVSESGFNWKYAVLAVVAGGIVFAVAKSKKGRKK